MLGVGEEKPAEIGDRDLALLELEIAPRQAIERVRGDRGASVLGDHALIEIAGVREPLHPEEGLGFPESRLPGLARGRGHALGAPEGVEGRLKPLLRQPRLADQQRRLADMRIGREAIDQPIEHADRQIVEAVLEGAGADRPEALGVVQRVRGGQRRHAGEAVPAGGQDEEVHEAAR